MKLRLLLLVLLLSSAYAEDWSRFRGPNGSGVSKDTSFPAEFGRDRNLIWRTPVRPGKSSPILTRRHVYLTAFDDGKLFTQCFDRKTGKLLWERAENRPRAEVGNVLNEPAALTPVTDGDNVYVFFADFGLISYDASGKTRWKTPLGPFTNVMGLGASPIFAGNSIVLVADQQDDSYIAAFDSRDGKIRWKTARQEQDGWATPLIFQPPGAAPQILNVSRGQLGAHSLVDGTRTGSYERLSPAIVASPVLVQDTLFTFGYGNESPNPFSGALAKRDKNQDGRITPDEQGDDAFLIGIGKYEGNRDRIVTKEEWDEKQRKVLAPSSLLAVRLERDPDAASGKSVRARELWRYEKSFIGVIPSPLLYDGLLYVVKNGGILTAFDQATGDVVKTGRVQEAIGGYSASPIAAEGMIFLTSEDGKVVVLRAGRDWSVVAVNDLGESCHATPALSNGNIYLRTSEALYCFGNGDRDQPR